MQFRFCCDESHNGNRNNPVSLAISGFFSDQATWKVVEEKWAEVNRRYNVSCFHATALNGGREEYENWPKPKRDEYSRELLAIVTGQKQRLCAFNCGIRANVYRDLISDEGRSKLGDPWFVCFKSCIAMIAKQMETLPAEDTFSVVVERGSGFDEMAVNFFRWLVNNPRFAYRHRLVTFTSERPQNVIGLQVADLMAFEYFKRLHNANRASEMRPPMRLIQKNNNYHEGFLGEDTFAKMKIAIESSICGPNELVIIPSL